MKRLFGMLNDYFSIIPGIILCVIILSSFITHSQVEEQIWHFGGTSKGLFFDASNGYTPVVTNNSYTPYGPEGCSVVSNPVSGNLIFYTDGIRVVDKSHAVMPNGAGLTGNVSSFSNGMSCVNPTNCAQFYVFSMNFAYETGNSGNLYYSIVDTNLIGNGTVASPLGDVISKNTLITDNVSEAMEIIPKANSRDYWILVPKNATNSIDIFELTPTGILFVSNFTIPHTMEDMRCIKYNRQNGKIALSSMVEINPTLLLNFDNSSGILSNTTIIPGTPWGTSTNYWQGTIDLEWSSDGTKLYISKYRWGSNSGGRLYQYDLNSPTNNPVMIFSVSNSNSQTAKGLERGPDNKIYMLTNMSSSQSFISCINNPNESGLGCNFVQNQIDMGISMSSTGDFPNFLHLNNSIPEIPDTNIITTLNSITFNPIDGYFDEENDNLTLTLLNTIGGTSSLSGNSLTFTSDQTNCGMGTITVSYCDDYCYPLCDSFQIYISNEQNSSTGIDVVNSCNSYTWIDGITYINSNSTANHIINGGASNGCDSVVTLNLTILPPNMGTDIISTCDAYTWIDGITYQSSNSTATHTIIGGSVNGCDSLVTLNLTIASPNTSIDTRSDCGPYTWMDGITYTANNTTATHTLMGAGLNGCDSIITLNLTIIPPVPGVDVIYACEPYEWIDGITYSTNNNTATHVLTGGSVSGCDSIVTLNLTIFPPIESTYNISSCEPYTWIDGITYYSSTNSPEFTMVAGSVYGCDSIINLNLVINQISISQIDTLLCEGDSILVGSNYVQTNTMISDTLIGGNYFGCDSIIEYNITFSPLPEVIVSSNVNSGCAPLSLVYYNLSNSNNISCSWNVEPINGTFSSCDSIEVLYSSEGVFDVGLTIFDSLGCKNTLDIIDFVHVYPDVIAAFTVNSSSLNVGNTEVYFTNTSFNSTNYTWNFDDNFNSSLENPIHEFPSVANSTYNVQLLAENSYGCIDSTTVLITIDDVVIIYVPNAFTPDDNNTNNIFKPILTSGFDPYDYHLIIFNRWGEIIFESFNSEFGWDGTYGHDSELCADGVYVWSIVFKDNSTEKKHQYNGHVTLLK